MNEPEEVSIAQIAVLRSYCGHALTWDGKPRREMVERPLECGCRHVVGKVAFRRKAFESGVLCSTNKDHRIDFSVLYGMRVRAGRDAGGVWAARFIFTAIFLLRSKSCRRKHSSELKRQRKARAKNSAGPVERREFCWNSCSSGSLMHQPR